MVFLVSRYSLLDSSRRGRRRWDGHATAWLYSHCSWLLNSCTL